MAGGLEIQFLDYLLFGLTLLISTAVGVYYSVKSAMRTTAESNVEYLLGGRKMPVIPTAMSVLTSILSSILLVGLPPDIYLRGVYGWLAVASGAVSMLINCFVFLPVFYKFRPTSVHDYFVARFNSYFLRTLVGGTFVFSTMFYMAIVMYAPALAMAKVANLPVWFFIVSVGVVCTFYTTLGGLKAVVWADTFQAVIMFVGVLVLVVKGTIDAGGWNRVWELSDKYGRLDALRNFDPSPFQYGSVLLSTVGGIPYWLGQYGVSQMAVQRYCSLETLGKARQVIAMTTPLYIILTSLPCFLALVMFAYFFDCDPVKNGTLRTPDQLVIYFVIRILITAKIPGFMGLFLACLCSGTLSTVSSGINSMVAVIWEDLVPWSCFTEGLKNRLGSRGSKFMALVLGVGCTGLAFSCEAMGGIMKAAAATVGAFTGPLAGLFALGVLFPMANRNGAVLGGFLSVFITFWLMFGNLFYKPYQRFVIPTYDYGCNATGGGLIANITTTLPPVQTVDPGLRYGDSSIFILYRISHWNFTLLGFLLVIVFGVLGSIVLPCKLPLESEEEKAEKMSLTICGVMKEEKDGVVRLRKCQRKFSNEQNFKNDTIEMS